MAMEIREELQAIDGVVDPLHAKFPHVLRERILVQEEHRSLDAGRVRDFIPILVEHRARPADQLTANPFVADDGSCTSFRALWL